MALTLRVALFGLLTLGLAFGNSAFSLAEDKPASEDQPAAPEKAVEGKVKEEKANEDKPDAPAEKANVPKEETAKEKPAKEKTTKEAKPEAAPKSPVKGDMVSVPQLIKNLKSDNLKVAASAARSLGVIFSPGGKGGEEKEGAVAGLIAGLSAARAEELRRESAVALGRIRAEAALEDLQKAMSDEEITVAAAAGESVGQIMPVDEARAYLIKRGEEETESVQAAAYHGLAPIAKPEDSKFLVEGLDANNWRTQQAAVRGLQRAVQEGARLDAEDYDEVAGVLGAETTNAADTALHFFLYVRNEDAFEALVKAVELKGDGSSQDVSWRTRTYALRTLQHLGWPSLRPALPAVIRQLGDKTANVTNSARSILNFVRKEQYISQEELFPLLLTELEGAELEGKQALKLRAGIMQEMGTNVDRQHASRVAKVAAETLAAAMEEQSEWPARANSLTLLGIAGYTGEMELIAKNVNDDIGNVQRAAGAALEQLSPVCSPEQRAEVSPILLTLLENPSDWRKTAVAARAAGDYLTPEMIAPLTSLLSHSVLNVREGAGHSLVTIVEAGDEKQRADVEQGLYVAMEENDGTWEFGAPVLGALGDVKAVPVLTKILERGEWRAKLTAANAVARIAEDQKINDKPLADGLIAAAQSEIIQLQDAANQALRVLNKEQE
jgi:HEAT repeat protein